MLNFSILHLGLPALSTPRGPKVTGEAKNGSSVTLDLKRDEFNVISLETSDELSLRYVALFFAPDLNKHPDAGFKGPAAPFCILVSVCSGNLSG